MCPKKQKPPIFYNVKTMFNVTKNAITSVVVVQFLKFKFCNEDLELSHRLMQLLKKLNVVYTLSDRSKLGPLLGTR